MAKSQRPVVMDKLACIEGGPYAHTNLHYTEYDTRMYTTKEYIHTWRVCVWWSPSGGALSHLGSRRRGSGRAGWALLRNCQKDLIDSQSVGQAG